MRLGVVILGLACATASLADTLVLRNGQTVHGTYLGGTDRTIRMQVEDAAKTFDVTDVAGLQFTAPATTSSPSSKSSFICSKSRTRA